MSARAGAGAIPVGLVVLTGGAARRMGVDKAGLDTGGVPLALRPVLALRPLCTEVVLAGRPVPGVDARVVPDARPGLGPLAGVAAGLAALEAGLAVVVGCDMPAVAPALVAMLLAELQTAGAVEAVVCERQGHLEPLPMVVRRGVVTALDAALTRGARSLREGLAALHLRVVGEDRWRRADPAGASFENWNHPGDVRPLPPARISE